jgi:hypothetical protein
VIPWAERINAVVLKYAGRCNDCTCPAVNTNMKAKFFLLSAVIALLMGSCKKNKIVSNNCNPAIACPDMMCLFFSRSFKFTVTDKTTGSDLIFGSNPVLAPADIKLFIRSNASYTPVIFLADSTQRSLNTVFARDTMELQIKNDPLKRIIVKTFCAKDCCGVIATEIEYDGSLLTANNSNIFSIKR